MSTAKKEDFRMSKQTKRILATLPKDEQPTFKKHMIDAEESFNSHDWVVLGGRGDKEKGE
jgi:hypothetical protein